MKIKKEIIKLKHLIYLAMFGVLFLMLSFLASAFAIGVSGNLGLYPGQSLDAFYDLMNTVGGSGDIVVEGQFVEGAEIASFSNGNRFELSAGSIVPISVRYKIPEDAPIGKVYNVKVFFKTVSSGSAGGSVGMVQDAEKSITVSVIQKPVEPVVPEASTKEITSSNAVWWWILGIVVLIIIVWMILRKKK